MSSVSRGKKNFAFLPRFFSFYCMIQNFVRLFCSLGWQVCSLFHTHRNFPFIKLIWWVREEEKKWNRRTAEQKNIKPNRRPSVQTKGHWGWRWRPTMTATTNNRNISILKHWQRTLTMAPRFVLLLLVFQWDIFFPLLLSIWFSFVAIMVLRFLSLHCLVSAFFPVFIVSLILRHFASEYFVFTFGRFPFSLSFRFANSLSLSAVHQIRLCTSCEKQFGIWQFQCSCHQIHTFYTLRLKAEEIRFFFFWHYCYYYYYNFHNM